MVGSTLTFHRVDRGPQASSHTVKLVGGESQVLNPNSQPIELNWLGQWLLGADLFTVRPSKTSKTYHHELVRCPERESQDTWNTTVSPTLPWFDSVREFRFPNGYSTIHLDQPRAKAFDEWQKLHHNHKLHPLVKDLFRKPQPLPGPQSWHWVAVEGRATPGIAGWTDVRSFWAATDIGMGVAFYAFGWSFDETFLNDSLLLQSIIASGDQVLLGVDESAAVRIVHWTLRKDMRSSK